MEDFSISEILSAAIGLTISWDEIKYYLNHELNNGACKILSKGNMLYITDESGSRLMCVVDSEKRDHYFTYDASTKLEAIISEYLPDLYDKENGSVVIEDIDGELYNLGAEIDFASVHDKYELPVYAVLKIYAMALSVDIFNSEKKYHDVVNENPVATSPEGRPIGIGSVFMTPTGIMPGHEKTAFPALTYVHAVVKKVEKKVHSYTKKEFFVLTCRGVMCDFEMLCDPEFMNENVQAGSVVVGYVMFRVEILETQKVEYEKNGQSEN